MAHIFRTIRTRGRNEQHFGAHSYGSAANALTISEPGVPVVEFDDNGAFVAVHHPSVAQKIPEPEQKVFLQNYRDMAGQIVADGSDHHLYVLSGHQGFLKMDIVD